MNFELNTKDLKLALSRIISVSDKKSTSNFQNECFFKINKNNIEILSTDNEIFAKVKIQANTKNENINFYTNSKSLFDIVKGINEENLKFEYSNEENSLKLFTQNSFYLLLTYDSDDFNFCIFPYVYNSITISRYSLM